MNKIKKICPTCKCPDGDVMAILFNMGEKKIQYRCLANGRKHTYFVLVKDETQKQELIDKGYFKAEALEDT